MIHQTDLTRWNELMHETVKKSHLNAQVTNKIKETLE